VKVKDLKNLIEYWPDEGEVHIEGCELEKEDIWCIATVPQWQEVNVKKLEAYKKTMDLFQRCVDDLHKENPESPDIKTLHNHICDLNEEIVRLETIIRGKK
jgi:hypothetical protein